MPRLSLAIASILVLGGVACGGDVTEGSGGSGGGTATTGSGGSTSSGTTSSGTTTGTGGGCPDCGSFTCCGVECVNPGNDILNCGTCGNACTGPGAYCDHGTCGTPPCSGQTCAGGETCCEAACCGPGQLCCAVPGPVGDTIGCHDPTPQGTCPTGCLDCICASPDTPVATPEGDRPIASLAVGDLVYSVDGEALRAVPVLRVHRTPAKSHHVVHLVLATGAVLDVSPGHPTADGRTFADLRAGDMIDGAAIVDARLVPYTHAYTHDVLPASDTGTYVAGGVLIGSTLHGRTSAE